MSVPTAELTAPALGAPRRMRSAGITDMFAGAKLYLILAAAGIAIGAISLLIPSTPSYDPWSWLVWGREIVHFNLQTTGGPTWKPLPVLFTTLFAPFGQAAPDMWLVIARMGGVMAAVMVFRIAARVTWWLGDPPADDATLHERAAAFGPALIAGAVATVALVFGGGFISDSALGYSEGLLTAAVLIAVDRHFDGHPRQAFAVGFAAALDRPEVWLFWGPYGLWLFWKDPGARRLVIALFALIPVLWFGPEYWGSGHFLRGATRALHPRKNSPAFASCPFCAELKDHAWPLVLLRIKVAGALAVGSALFLLWRVARVGSGLKTRLQLRTRSQVAYAAVAVSGLIGVAWWVVIAVLTQAGFSGNNRYLVLGAALVEIAGGVGFGWLALSVAKVLRRNLPVVRERLRSYAGTVATVAVSAFFIVVPHFVGSSLIDIQRTHASLVYQAHLRQDAQRIVSDLGGAQKVLACGSVMTEGFQVPMVAWYLGVHTYTIKAQPTPDPQKNPLAIVPGPGPNVILQARDTRHAALLPLPTTIIHWEQTGTHYTYRHVRTFRLFTACRK